MEKQKPNESATECCGQDCSCNAPRKGRKIKIAISLIALAGIVGILIFKFFYKSLATNEASTDKAAVFSIDNAFREKQALPMNDSNVPLPKDMSKIGDYVESLNDLNKAALNQDAVFVFIPLNKKELVKEQTIKSAFSAQKILKNNKITLGLYTLITSSPDYAGISRQVQPPAILVATKGKGMVAVTGDITESKLLQAFINTSRAGGCNTSRTSGCCPLDDKKKPADCVTK